MAQSILGRLKSLSKALINKCIDNAVDMNSPEMLKQGIRDYEDAQGDMRNARAEAKADLVMAGKELGELQALIDSTNKKIDLLLGTPNDRNNAAAADFEAKLKGYETDLTTKQTTHAALQTAYTTLENIAHKMDVKHTEMVTALARLTSMDAAAKAQEKAAEALQAAGNLASSVGDGPSIDNLTQRVEHRLAVANAKIEQQMGAAADTSADAVQDLEVQQRLEARKARLAAQKTST